MSDKTSIEELGLNITPYLCLIRAGIDTVEKLESMSDEELMKLRNLGRKRMTEVKEKLALFKAEKRNFTDSQ